jgi:hypothetical protein
MSTITAPEIVTTAAKIPALKFPVGAVVCEPQLSRTPYTIEGAHENIAPGQLLLAPLDSRKRRNRATWYFAFPADLEVLKTTPE